MAEQEKQLQTLRKEIDSLDEQIQNLINKRAHCAQKVADVKQQALEAGKDISQAIYYRPEREAQVLRRIMARNEGPVSSVKVARIFREIMSCCLALEQPLTIAYLGPEGTYSHAAALKHFGRAVIVKPLLGIDDVFQEVETGRVHYGIVPVQNSTEGTINVTLDSFIGSTLQICGEVELRIHHHFLVTPETDPKDINCIYSHYQSLAQCRRWLDKHWSGTKRITVNSNGEAARKASEQANAAAIAGEMAAELYGLEKLAEQIEDQQDNSTRFLIVGNHCVPPSSLDKTSVVVSTKNETGALYNILAPFNKYNISLTRIETRPSRTGTWSYVFFIDFNGHQQDPVIQKVLEEVRKDSMEIKILGSYPQAVM